MRPIKKKPLCSKDDIYESNPVTQKKKVKTVKFFVGEMMSDSTAFTAPEKQMQCSQGETASVVFSNSTIYQKSINSSGHNTRKDKVEDVDKEFYLLPIDQSSNKTFNTK